jgi:sortase A
MAEMIIKLTVYLLLVAGGFMVCDGMWLRVKAIVAQKLLHSAWEETVRTGVSVKPWPWADSWPVARLRVERLGIDHIVLEGDSGEVLAFGPGRLTNSAVVGSSGNCILAGHRDTSFTFLQELEPGDTVNLEGASGRSYTFQVTSAHVRNNHGLFIEQSDSPWLTMITCYPFNAIKPGTDQRYVVFARMLGSTES